MIGTRGFESDNKKIIYRHMITDRIWKPARVVEFGCTEIGIYHLKEMKAKIKISGKVIYAKKRSDSLKNSIILNDLNILKFLCEFRSNWLKIKGCLKNFLNTYLIFYLKVPSCEKIPFTFLKTTWLPIFIGNFRVLSVKKYR